VIPSRQSLLKEPQPLDDLVGGVHIKRRPMELGESFERDFAAVQGAVWLRMIEGT
jgi:hypothetical protein